MDKFKRCESNPGAVISTDTEGLLTYKKKKAAMNRINTLENKISGIEEQMRLSNALMAKILEKLNDDNRS